MLSLSILKNLVSIVWWLSEEVSFSYWEVSWKKSIIAKWWFVAFSIIWKYSVWNLYINYHTLSTPGDLSKSFHIFSNRIIPYSSSLIYKLLVHINLNRQMPSKICNKEITINGEKNYWNRKGPFIQYLSSEPIGSRLITM